VEPALPGGHGSQLGTVGVDLVPVDLTAAGVDIDLLCAEPTGALPEEAANPEYDDDGKSQVGLEEAFGIVIAATNGAYSDVEL